MQNAIQQAYYKPELAFRAKNVLNYLRQNGYPNITLKEVQQIIDQQETQQRFRQNKRPSAYFPILSKGHYRRAQCDLMEMAHTDNPRANEGYRYIFNFILVKSRFLFAVGIKNKTALECTRALKKVIEQIKELNPRFGQEAKGSSGGTVCQLDADNESAFQSAPFQAICRENNIVCKFVPSEIDVRLKGTVGIIERSNGTLRQLLERWKLSRKTQNWSKALDILVGAYNNSVHSSLKKSPVDALKTERNPYYEEKMRKQILKSQATAAFKQGGHQYQVGDRVRIMIKREMLGKKNGPSWSSTIHTIEKVLNNNSFIVSDRKSPYKRTQLMLYKSHSEIPALPEEKYNELPKRSANAEEEPVEPASDYKRKRKIDRKIAYTGVDRTKAFEVTPALKTERTLKRLIKPVDRGLMINTDENRDDWFR